MALNHDQLFQTLSKQWDEEIIPVLCDYVEIPNQSPYFDKEWEENGYLDQAADLLIEWTKKQKVEGLTLELVKEKSRTPLIFITINGNNNTEETVLMYGHMDKQPPLNEGWIEGLGPYTPVIKDGKLYGRGASDDGYSIFAAVSSIAALQGQGVPHARIVIIIEACEESGSPDLPFYVDLLTPKIGTPSLIVCLDSGAGNYEQFWITTSLRGMVAGDLTVRILNEGVHSGAGSGIIPSSFRIIRQLLSRVEDEDTGIIKNQAFYTTVPQKRIDQIKECCQALGDTVYTEFPFVEGAKPVTNDLVELLLNRAWRPALSITGAEGFPALQSAGNVLRTHSSLKLSLRIPPNVDPVASQKTLKNILEENPPYSAKVTFSGDKAGPGWEAPALADWLEEALNFSSKTFFKKGANYLGEGGSIPFMGMLGKKFPQAQFIVTGVLGPQSNAHGPNEFLHIDFTKKVTACVATILSKHHTQFCSKK